jgi:23S rRNA pseudouridine2604 synthase
MTIRLSKLMSEKGICSRREADAYIERGLVRVNGSVVSMLGTKVEPDAHIELLEEAKVSQKKKVTLLLNKPIGYVSTQPEKGYRPAIELIRPTTQVGPGKFHPSMLHKLSVAGRLDIDSKGLLLFTQDGTLVKKLIGPESEIEKEYLVRVEGNVTSQAIALLTHGLSLDGKALKLATIQQLAPQMLQIILTEGKKRQIRRMCELVNLKVISLKRVRIGNFTLGNLPEGHWKLVH